MTREQVLALFPEGGVSEETLNEIMKLKGLAVNEAIAGVKPPVDVAELERLRSIETEYEKQKQEGLTEAQKLQALIDETNRTKMDFTKRSNKLEAEKILLAAGLKLEDCESLIDGIVSENLETTTAMASGLAKLLANQKEAVKKATEIELMDKTKTPGGGSPGKKDDELSEAEKAAEGIVERMASSKETSETIVNKFL